jgi:hypothetical protein
VSGDTALIGAYRNSGAALYAGAAYVFVRSGTTWSQQAELPDPAPAGEENFFGSSVALSGNTAVVGATLKNANAGAAYVFVRNGTTWSQQAELTASDGVPFDEFGGSVAVSGTTILVGANGNLTSPGAAYVFVRSGTTWSQQAKLTASDATASDAFGTSVALSGNTALVGAAGSNSFTGAAYVFVPSGATWTQQAKLTASNGAAGDAFGNAVALSGNTALVGAAYRSNYAGAAYVFVRNGTTWTQQAALTAGDRAANDYFGNAVALSGNIALVGANAKNSDAGAAYVFMPRGTTWSQQAELTDPAPTGLSDAFGAPLALQGTTALIGAPGKNADAGAVYVFVPSRTGTGEDAPAE